MLILAVLICASAAGFWLRFRKAVVAIRAAKPDKTWRLRPLAPRIGRFVWEVLLQGKVIFDRPMPCNWAAMGTRASHAPSARVLALALVAATVLAAGSASVPASASTFRAGPVPGTTFVHGDTVPAVAHVGPTSFSGLGPLGVGETTLTLPTDGASEEVWYPATKASVAGMPEATYDVATWLPPPLKKLVPPGFSVTYPSGGVVGVPVAPGRYPLVVFSHGYAGFRDQSTFLTAHLASWGFVVAAPDHDSRDLTEVLGGPTGATAKTTDVADLEATIALMRAENARASSPFRGHVDTSLVGAVGHSAGGAAVEALAALAVISLVYVGVRPRLAEYRD